ncbi:MAG: glutaredoxin domain-containing protein [Ilumatobacteraceae bacterium]
MTPDAVHFYWRPGCPFCSMLRRGLDGAGIVTVDHDIWADDDDAATVRSYARGNETVPTVVIGDVGMVNPSIGQVVQHLEAAAPHLLPEGHEPAEPGVLGRLFGR